MIQLCNAMTLTTAQAGPGQRALQLGQAAALLQIGRDLVIPGLDRRVARLAGDLDLLQERRRPDRARIEAIDKLAHGIRSSPPVVAGRVDHREPGSSGVFDALLERRPVPIGQKDHPGVVGDARPASR